MYLILYSLISFFSVILWAHILNSFRNPASLFLFVFTFFCSAWFIFYFLFFSSFFDSWTLLFLSRANFLNWVLAVYSLLFFIYYFDAQKLNKYFIYVLSIIIALLVYIFLCTDLIIHSLLFDPVENLYREIYGKLYVLLLFLYGIFIVAFLYTTFFKLRDLNNLNKLRLKRIIYSAYFMLITLIFLQIILPLFNIWILENQIIFLYLFFVIQVYLTLNRYYFDSSWLWIGKSLVYILAFSISALVYIFINIYFPDGIYLGAFWDFPYSRDILNVTMSIWLFVFTQKLLTKYVIWNENKESIREHIFSLQNQIVSILDTDTLNKILFEWLNKVFLLKHAHLFIFDKDKKSKKFLHLKKYFEKSSYTVYIHDIVFWEEKSDYQHIESVKSEISEGIFMVLPLLFEGKCLGIFAIWSKNFNDAYTREEIGILENFSRFLSAHVRYLAIYDDLQDLSLNLDKKVDEKTIDYNNLINRQKEFIAMISHEVRSPMSSAIFQWESLIEDLDRSDFSPEKLKENLRMLTAQLMRMGDIIAKLFSVQYYDNNSVQLFLERIQFVKFLEHEVDLFTHVHTDITVITDFDKDIWFIKIDKIQFQQVLGNLLSNAVKFTQNEDAIIALSAHKKEKWVQIILEDNGKWFEGIKMEELFDIYATGNNKNIWLGMWLYLCKKIIALHGGTIKPSTSKQYGWACFTIFLPAWK